MICLGDACNTWVSTSQNKNAKCPHEVKIEKLEDMNKKFQIVKLVTIATTFFAGVCAAVDSSGWGKGFLVLSAIVYFSEIYNEFDRSRRINKIKGECLKYSQ